MHKQMGGVLSKAVPMLGVEFTAHTTTRNVVAANFVLQAFGVLEHTEERGQPCKGDKARC